MSPSLDFEVFCSCGRGLCNQSEVQSGRWSPKVVVEPCSRCLEEAKQEGYDLGYRDGLRDAKREEG